jgi:hypothetical protein
VEAQRVNAVAPFEARSHSQSLLSDQRYTERAAPSVQLGELTRPSTGFVRVVSEANPSWLKPALDQLIPLLSLPEGWNSYRARRIGADVVRRAIEVLAALMPEGVPPPSIVPTVRGGVQLEWHRFGKDLEIEIEPTLRIHALGPDDGEPEQEIILAWPDWLASVGEALRQIYEGE